MSFTSYFRRSSFRAVLAAGLAALLLPLPVAEAQRLSLEGLSTRIETLEDAVFEPGPGVNFVGRNLTGVPLAGLDLRAAHAVGATGFGDLTGANLAFADLRNADLSDSTLCRTDLSDANLKDAIFPALQTADVDACDPGPIAVVNEFTTCVDGQPLGTRDVFACLNITVIPTPGAVTPTSGAYGVAPTIGYACQHINTGFVLVNVSIGSFEFAVNGTSISVSGAPVVMTGTVNGSGFSVSGTIPGTVDEVYSLTGSFSDADTWTGTFGISFVGDTSGTTCASATFAVMGARLTTTASSGTFLVDPAIGYTCQDTFFGSTLVNVAIGGFGFSVNGVSVSVSGAPVVMTGAGSGTDFTVSGTIFGDVDEVYSLTGSFSDADNWTGTFNISFVGDTSFTTCADQMFPVTATRQ